MNSPKKALDAYLVADARIGNRRALARLMQLRGPRLMAHATRLLGDGEGERDVVQDAWVEVMRGLGGLRDDGAFLPWALQIVSRRVACRNRCRTCARRNCAIVARTIGHGGAVLS
jgi:DNA-directed RNA polymerase specialized sigma24 family protein